MGVLLKISPERGKFNICQDPIYPYVYPYVNINKSDNPLINQIRALIENLKKARDGAKKRMIQTLSILVNSLIRSLEDTESISEKCKMLRAIKSAADFLEEREALKKLIRKKIEEMKKFLSDSRS